MKCPQCNTEKPQEALYCRECAYRLPPPREIKCPECGFISLKLKKTSISTIR
ncbi:zinc ribbon domain-containing protein [Chloroflexota bacterium]